MYGRKTSILRIPVDFHRPVGQDPHTKKRSVGRGLLLNHLSAMPAEKHGAPAGTTFSRGAMAKRCADGVSDRGKRPDSNGTKNPVLLYRLSPKPSGGSITTRSRQPGAGADRKLPADHRDCQEQDPVALRHSFFQRFRRAQSIPFRHRENRARQI